MLQTEGKDDNLMVELKAEPQKLTAYLSGEIDHHRAKELREQIDLAVREQLPPVVVLDFRRVTFMDSSGIGLIMGRARLMEEYGGVLEIHNPSPQIRKVLRISGADRLAVLRNTKQTGSGKEQEHEYAQ
jgi:stage II sporulation protein AA (anti-sigma F factor antagonist)